MSAHPVRCQQLDSQLRIHSRAAGLFPTLALGFALAIALTACDSTSTSVNPSAAKTLNSIAVTVTPTSIAVGANAQASAVGTYSDGSTASLTSGLTWTSLYPSIAGINSTGLMTGLAPGFAWIAASLGSVTSAQVSVTVTAGSTATLTGLAVTVATSTLITGHSAQATAMGSYNDGSTQNITASVIWNSSATSTAVVSPAGKVTGGPVGGSSSISAAKSGITSNSVPVSVIQATGLALNNPLQGQTVGPAADTRFFYPAAGAGTFIVAITSLSADVDLYASLNAYATELPSATGTDPCYWTVLSASNLEYCRVTLAGPGIIDVRVNGYTTGGSFSVAVLSPPAGPTYSNESNIALSMNVPRLSQTAATGSLTGGSTYTMTGRTSYHFSLIAPTDDADVLSTYTVAPGGTQTATYNNYGTTGPGEFVITGALTSQVFTLTVNGFYTTSGAGYILLAQ